MTKEWMADWLILIIDEEDNDGDVDKRGSEGECFPLAASLNGQCLADNDDDNVDDDDKDDNDDNDDDNDDDGEVDYDDEDKYVLHLYFPLKWNIFAFNVKCKTILPDFSSQPSHRFEEDVNSAKGWIVSKNVNLVSFFPFLNSHLSPQGMLTKKFDSTLN